MRRPKVSICIPAYKRVRCLRRALRSIALQTFEDYEVIITDDSPDDQVERAVEDCTLAANIIYHKNRKRLGPASNWDVAVRRASGDYVKMLLTDDWFTAETSLDRLVSMLDDEPKADFGFCSSLNVSSQRAWVPHSLTEEDLVTLTRQPTSLFFANIIGSPSATIYRRSHEMYDGQLKWLLDIDFYVRYLESNPTVVFCPEPLVCVTANDGGQLSSQLAGNKFVELFEYTYLFDKLCRNDLNPISDGYLMFFARLLRKHQVKSVEDIEQLNSTSSMHRRFFNAAIALSAMLRCTEQKTRPWVILRSAWRNSQLERIGPVQRVLGNYFAS